MENNKLYTLVEWLEQEMLKPNLSMKEILEQAKEMEKKQKIKNITDYNIKVTEFLLNPLFNLEHSKHGIACEKLSDIRNQFINDHIVNYNETYGGNKWTKKKLKTMYL